MPAAPPGTETLTLPTGDGQALAVTLHYDPDTRAWSDPAITADGDGGAVLYLATGDGSTAVLAVQAGVPIAAAVMAAVGSAGRGTFSVVLVPSADGAAL
jgi:hypothetical protein